MGVDFLVKCIATGEKMRLKKMFFICVAGLTYTAAMAGPLLHEVSANAEKATTTSTAATLLITDINISSVSRESGDGKLKANEWVIKRGHFLCDTLKSWSIAAGWNTVCSLGDTDYEFGVGETYTGEFQEAVKKMINSLPQEIKVKVHIYAENTPPLLHLLEDGGVKQ